MSIEAQLTSSATSVRRPNWRLVAYWVVTVLVAYENLDGFVWSVLHIGYITDIATHLGYPLYFINILGTFQLACSVALLVPGLPVVKEWAYTGAFINYSSALASHVIVGDPPGVWTPSVIMLVLLVASWGLRPSDRRTNADGWRIETRLTKWITPVVLLGTFTILGLVTLPTSGALQQ
jgi:DoxX-like family